MLRGLIHSTQTLKPNNKSLIDTGFSQKIFFFHSQDNSNHISEGFYLEYPKKRKLYKKLLPLDPFNLEKFERKESVKEELDTNLPLSITETLNSFSISSDDVTTGALGNNEQRVTSISKLVNEFLNELSPLARFDLFRVLLLMFSSVNLDMDKLRSTVKFMVKSGVDPAKMLELQPTVLSLDVNILFSNIKQLLEIARPKFENIKFNQSIFNELNKLASHANNSSFRSEGVEQVEMLYRAARYENLYKFSVYKRVFQAIKSTALSDKNTDTEIHKLCSTVYKRLYRMELTCLCSRHFKEIALGMSEELQTDLQTLRETGIQGNKWVGRYLERISDAKIPIRDPQKIQQIPSLISLLGEYGVDVNTHELIWKCPMLLNSPLNDIIRSIELLGHSPFYCNRADISRVITRDPGILVKQELLSNARQQFEQTPLLRHRQIHWHTLIKRTPSVLTTTNFPRIIDELEKLKYSKDEIITLLEYYPSAFKRIQNLLRKLDEVVPNSQKLELIQRMIPKRIKQETFYRYHGRDNKELID